MCSLVELLRILSPNCTVHFLVFIIHVGHATPLRSSPRLNTATAKAANDGEYNIYVTAGVKLRASVAEGPVCHPQCPRKRSTICEEEITR